jgi:hypothetical protein
MPYYDGSSLCSTEWNNVRLVNNPSAPLSTSGSTRMRLNSSALEVSINGQPYRKLADHYFNVKHFGAKGDYNGTTGTDDTAAFQAAISAATAQAMTCVATSGGGAVVYVPRGCYLIDTGALTMGQGVTLVGEGVRTSQLVFKLDSVTDAITWSNPTQYGRGGGMWDIDFRAAPGFARDLIKLNNWGSEFSMYNVRAEGGDRYTLHTYNGIHQGFHDCRFAQGGTACVMVDYASETVATTIRFYNCYIAGSPKSGAIVRGLGIDFFGCIFESNGAGTDAVDGVGIRVRSGWVGLYSPYFENQTWHDMDLGSEAPAYVTVLNPPMMAGVYSRAGSAHLKGTYLQGGLIAGGNWDRKPKAVILTCNSHSAMFSIAGATGPNTDIRLEYNGGNIRGYPGIFNYSDAVTGEKVLGGRGYFQLGDNSTWISKHLASEYSVNAFTINSLTHATSIYTLAGISGNDVLEVGYSSGANDVMLQAKYHGRNQVRVTWFNPTDKSINVPAGTLTIAATRHVW